MKNIIKKILAIWISIYLIVIPPFAHAASAGGWSFSAFDVATSVVTAFKNGASASVAVAKSPIASKIAKGIVGGAIAGAALPLAISQISGIALNAVDWLLDPANNAIKWTAKPGSGAGVYVGVDYPASANNVTDMCNQMWQAYYSNVGGVVFTFDRYELEGTNVYCHFKYGEYGRRLDGKFQGSGSIPIPVVADKIYDNAKTDSDSRSVVNDAVKSYVNEGSADVALDTAKADADATHNCGSGTQWNGSVCIADTPSTPTTDTPFDPSSILAAIASLFDAVMSIPDVINTAIDGLLVDIKDFFQPVIDLFTDFIKWFKDTALDWKNNVVTEYQDVKKKVIDTYDEFIKPDNTPTDVDVNVPQTQTIDTDINFGGSCPANVTSSFVIGGRTTTFNVMDFSQFCLIMSTYLKPLVIALASYQAVKILAGRNESN